MEIPNSKQQQLTFDKGITNVPSDAICSDNALSECAGLVYDNGEYRPIQKPEREWGDNQPPKGFEESKLIFVHGYNGLTRYIFWDYASQELNWTDEEASRFNLFGRDVSSQPIIAAIGNTLIVSSKEEGTNLRYFIWKPQDNNYTEIGEIPQPDVKFWLVNGDEVIDPDSQGPEVYVITHYQVHKTNTFDESCLEHGISPLANNRVLNQSVLNDSVFGIYWQCENLVKEREGFTRPFWLRYALRLYNGDYVYHSQPILVIPSWYNNCNLVLQKITEPEIDCVMYYGKLCYQINTDYSDFTDIVKGIDVFVSDQVPLYLTDRAAVDFRNRNGWLGYGGYFTQDYTEGVSPMTARVGNYENQMGTTLIKAREHSDVMDDLISMSTFYKLCELGTRSMARYEWLPIKDQTLKNITTQQTLQHDDFFSRAPLSAKYMGVYNHRLQLANVSRGFFSGFERFILAEYYYNPLQLMAVVDIHTDSGDRTVRKTFSSREIIPNYFYYPDPRAFKVRVYQKVPDSTYELLYEKDLKEHPGLNGAYYLDLFDNSDYEPQQGVNPPSEYTAYEQLQNQFMQSEVDNPFVFYADGYTRVGDGEIIGFASQTTALSEGQFGQFPMLVFTSEGVWALAVSNTGLYTNVYPISRDVCNNPSSITPTDGAVFFSTQKGLMVTIGRDVKHVSPQLNSDFIRYLSNQNTIIGYDYRDSLLWIANPQRSFVWIYNIKDGVFSSYSVNGLVAMVNNYPDTIIQTQDNLWSLLKRPQMQDDENTYDGVIETRPMKFENGLALKSIMQLKNIYQMEGSVTLCIFASNNLTNWVELNSLRGMPWKYFRFHFDFSNMKATDRFAGTVLITQERRTDKLR